MHLAYLRQSVSPSLNRRDVMRGALGAGGLAASAAILGGPISALAATDGPGFKGAGPMTLATGEDWIDTFFSGGADAIIHYYADEFVFEDVTFAQAIDNKEDLHRAFVPFNNAGPDAPTGVHQFDIIRYTGGPAANVSDSFRTDVPAGYSPEDWAAVTREARMGAKLAFDEWSVINWVWKAKHNGDFLGMPAKGKTTFARGSTQHFYRKRKIVREYTSWDFRGVAVQLGALPPQEKFWLKDYKPTTG